jgi:hypothetical protein
LAHIASLLQLWPMPAVPEATQLFANQPHIWLPLHGTHAEPKLPQAALVFSTHWPLEVLQHWISEQPLQVSPPPAHTPPVQVWPAAHAPHV